MKEALVLSGVTKKFSNGRGIHDIDLTVRKGERLGILGPNGAGKTTLLKCITGLSKPDSGKITLFSHDIEKNYKEAIESVGAMVGHAMTIDYMTPLQNLKMALRYYPEIPTTYIDEILETVGLYPYKYEKILSFSMGMKQRFALAMALISKPQLIIMDEPTNGLDIDGLLQLRRTIKKLEDLGITFVISSHHISELEKMCDRFCFLIDGRLSQLEATGTSLEDEYINRIGGIEVEALIS